MYKFESMNYRFFDKNVVGEKKNVAEKIYLYWSGIISRYMIYIMVYIQFI